MWFDNTAKEASLLRDYGTRTFPALLFFLSVGLDPFGSPISFVVILNYNREFSCIFFDASENYPVCHVLVCSLHPTTFHCREMEFSAIHSCNCYLSYTCFRKQVLEWTFTRLLWPTSSYIFQVLDRKFREGA